MKKIFKRLSAVLVTGMIMVQCVLPVSANEVSEVVKDEPVVHYEVTCPGGGKHAMRPCGRGAAYSVQIYLVQKF